MVSEHTIGSESSDFYENDKPMNNAAGLTQALTALQRLDRPVDTEALRFVLDECCNYFVAALHHGAERDLNKETIFLRPLFREALPQVFMRFLLNTEWQQLDRNQVSRAHYTCIRLVIAAGQATSLFKMGKGENEPFFTVDELQNLQGLFQVLSMMITPNQQTSSLMMHGRFEKLVHLIGQFGVQAATVPFVWAAPEGYEQANSYEELPPDDLTIEHLYIVNLSNWFGDLDGWATVVETLYQPERLGVEGTTYMMQLLAQGVYFFKPEKKLVAKQLVEVVAGYIDGAYTAAKDFSGFGDAAVDKQVYNTLTQLINAIHTIASTVLDPIESYNTVIPLQRELALRLLSSGNFTKQLQGVKELFGLLLRSGQYTTKLNDFTYFKNVMAWIEEQGIIKMMLQSNLHHQQYAEAAQKVLGILLKHGLLADEHLDFLWNLTQDASTHEEIRANAHYLLGTLAPFMGDTQRNKLFTNLLHNAERGNAAEKVKAAELLSTIARHDKEAALGNAVLTGLLRLVFSPNAPDKLIEGSVVAEACTHYENVGGLQHSMVVVSQCMASMKENKAPIAAALVLLSLLRTVYQKPEKQSVFYKHFNQGADLLITVIKAYTEYLNAYKALKLHGQGDKKEKKEPLKLSIDAAYQRVVLTFPHEKAVELFNKLLYEVVHKGNFFLLLDQMANMLDWVRSATSPYSIHEAWQLLTALVMGRKEIMIDAATNFFTQHLCTISPNNFTPAGWRCLTAYMAALSQPWRAALIDKSIGDYSEDVGISQEESVWKKTHSILWKLSLDASDMVAGSASRLLARLLANKGRKTWNADEYHVTLETEIKERMKELQQLQEVLCGRAAVTWSDAPPVVVGGERVIDEGLSEVVDVEGCAKRAERIVTFLNFLVEEGMANAMPTKPSHACSYSDFNVKLELQNQQPIPQGQQQTAANTPAVQKFTHWLPGNTYVGLIRMLAKDHWLKITGTYVPVSHIRIISGGKEFVNDAQTVTEARLNQHVVMFSVNMKPNTYSGLSTDARAALDAASPAYCLANTNDGSIYPTVITLANLQDSQSTATARMRAAAQKLLYKLPTCPSALTTLKEALEADNGGQVLASLLQQQQQPPPPQQTPVLSGAATTYYSAGGTSVAGSISGTNDDGADVVIVGGEVKEAVLLYALQSLCVLLLPANHTFADTDTITAAKEQAARLLPRLIQSGILNVLLSHLTARPSLGGSHPSSAADCHLALLRLVQELGENLERMCKEPPQEQEQPTDGGGGGLQQEGSAMSLDQPEGGGNAGGGNGGGQVVVSRQQQAEQVRAAIAPSAVDYILGVVQAALNNFTSSPSATTTEPSSSDIIISSIPAAMQLTQYGQELLCRTSLNLLGRNFLTNASGLDRFINNNNTATTAGRVFHALLKHPLPTLRKHTALWLEGGAKRQPQLRHWAFANIIKPLLLNQDKSGSGNNYEETNLCTKFLESLAPEELPLAKELLQSLIQQCLEAIAHHRPLGSIADTLLTLLKQLAVEDTNLDHLKLLTKYMIEKCLFPEVFAMRKWFNMPRLDKDRHLLGVVEVFDKQLDSVPLEELVAGHDECVLGYSKWSDDCRSSVFMLLYDLMTHDLTLWKPAYDRLRQVLETSLKIYSNKWKNTGLPVTTPPNAFVGLQNGGATCYMNSIFQQLYMQPTTRTLVLSSTGVEKVEQEESVFHQVQSMFGHLAVGAEPWYEPQGFWKAFKDYEGQPVNIREHQDAYEFFTRLQDSVDEYLRAQGRPRAIFEAMGGTFAQVITVSSQRQIKSIKEEEFVGISLDVRGKRNLIESLNSYVAVELMDGPNQYFSEALNKKVDAEKRVLLGRLPNTLVFHLKRFEFDYETFQRWKIKDRFEFPLDLNVKPFTVEGAADTTNTDTTTAMQTNNDNNTDTEDSQYEYELRGIVIHSGSAFAGHYYSYIKDRSTTTSPGTVNGTTTTTYGPRTTTNTSNTGWYCFDDTSVDPWNPEQLEIDCFGGKYSPEGSSVEYDRPHSAYMLFYERKHSSTEKKKSEAVGVGAVGAVGGAENNEDVAMDIPDGGGDATTNNNNTNEAMHPAVQGGVDVDVDVDGSGSVLVIPYAMPEELYRTLVWNNMRLIATSHLVGHDFANTVIQELSHQARLIAFDLKPPQPNKKAARTAVAASPGGGGNNNSMLLDVAGGDGDGEASEARYKSMLLNMFEDSNGGGGSDVLLGNLGVLLFDYYAKVIAHAPADLIDEFARKPKDKMLCNAMIHFIKSNPSIGQAILKHLGNPYNEQDFQQSLFLCPWFNNVRHALRYITCAAISSAGHGLQNPRGRNSQQAIREFYNVCKDFTDQFIARLSMPMPQRKVKTGYCVEDYFQVLGALTLYPALRPVFDENLQIILDFWPVVLEGWGKMSIDDRFENEYARIYLSVLARCTTWYDMREVFMSEDCVLQDNAYFQGDTYQPEPCPDDLYNFYFSDYTTIRSLMMPGCVNADTDALFKFLSSDNSKHVSDISTALLQHVLVDCDVESLVGEAQTIAEIACLNDSLLKWRLEDFIIGPQEDQLSNYQQQQDTKPPLGLFPVVFHLPRDKVRRFIVIRIILLMYSEQPELVRNTIIAALPDCENDGDLRDWAHLASSTICEVQSAVENNVGFRDKLKDLDDFDMVFMDVEMRRNMCDMCAAVDRDFEDMYMFTPEDASREEVDDEDDDDNNDDDNGGGGGENNGNAAAGGGGSGYGLLPAFHQVASSQQQQPRSIGPSERPSSVGGGGGGTVDVGGGGSGVHVTASEGRDGDDDDNVAVIELLDSGDEENDNKADDP